MLVTAQQKFYDPTWVSVPAYEIWYSNLELQCICYWKLSKALREFKTKFYQPVHTYYSFKKSFEEKRRESCSDAKYQSRFLTEDQSFDSHDKRIWSSIKLEKMFIKCLIPAPARDKIALHNQTYCDHGCYVRRKSSTRKNLPEKIRQIYEMFRANKRGSLTNSGVFCWVHHATVDQFYAIFLYCLGWEKWS